MPLICHQSHVYISNSKRSLNSGLTYTFVFEISTRMTSFHLKLNMSSEEFLILFYSFLNLINLPVYPPSSWVDQKPGSDILFLLILHIVYLIYQQGGSYLPAKHISHLTSPLGPHGYTARLSLHCLLLHCLERSSSFQTCSQSLFHTSVKVSC